MSTWRTTSSFRKLQLSSPHDSIGETGIDRLLQQLLERTVDAILVADRQGQVRYWNTGAEQMFGYSAVEAVGQSLDLIIPENLRFRHWEWLFPDHGHRANQIHL